MATARVLVVDDDQGVLKLVSRMLENAGFDTLPVNEPHRVLEIVTRREPPVDVVLSDVQMPGMMGTELVHRLAQISPRTPAVLMSGSAIEEGSVPVGVTLLKKPFPWADLIAAVQSALRRAAELQTQLSLERERFESLRTQHEKVWSETKGVSQDARRIVQASRDLSNRLPRENFFTLTRREVEVLKLMADGMSTKQVAGTLGVSFKTAVSHRSHILEKLNVHTTVAAVRWAIRAGLVEP